MASARFAWGIDVGNRALKAVKLVRDPAGQLKIDDFEVIEHETVLSNAGDNRDSLIQSAIANFVQRHPMKGGGAISIGVSGQASFARFIKLPPVEPSKIPEIVRFEAIQQIPFPLDDVEWSYQLFQDPGSPDVEVGIFAMRKELVNHIIKQFTDVDLNVQVVQMNPLAVYNAMQNEGRISGTTMIIDMGAENTDLIIAEGETIWLRSIPVGGNNFTEALAKSFKLNFPKAEELKRNAPSSKFAKQIFQAMRPIFADLVSEIQRSIGFYASVHRESRISKIIALGGAFRLPGLQKYLQQNLQLDVERVDRYAIGQPDDAKLAASYNENLLSIASAYGLAVQAMGDAKITSSLLPEKIRRERMWKDKTKWFALAAACFVVGSGIAYGRYYTENFRMQTAIDTKQPKINEVRTKATALDAAWSKIETEGAPDRQRINSIRSLESYRTFWPELIAAIHRSLPTPQPVLLTGDPAKIKSVPRKERRQILIEGISTRYIANMGPVLADPNFSKYISESAVPIAPEATPMGGGEFGMDPSMMDMGGGAPAPIPGGPGDPNAKRGYLVTIRCNTPFGNPYPYNFIDQTIRAQLLAISQEKVKPGQQFYIAKAEVITARKIADSPGKQAVLNTNYQLIVKDRPQVPVTPPGGGSDNIYNNRPPMPGTGGPPPYPGAGGPPPGPGGAPGPDLGAFADRVTGEDVREDWDIVLLLAVVIDPTPLPPPAPGTTPVPVAAAPAPTAPAPTAPVPPPAGAPVPPAAGTPTAPVPPVDAAATGATPPSAPTTAPTTAPSTAQ